jgi:hypothetical protein
MTEDQHKSNSRTALEATAKHFGISVEDCARQLLRHFEGRDEASANIHSSTLNDMLAVAPTDVVRDIVRDHRVVHGPSAQGIVPSSQSVTNVRGTSGRGTGWSEPTQLQNPPGVNWVDRIAIADEVRQRAEKKRDEESRCYFGWRKVDG